MSVSNFVGAQAARIGAQVFFPMNCDNIIMRRGSPYRERTIDEDDVEPEQAPESDDEGAGAAGESG